MSARIRGSAQLLLVDAGNTRLKFKLIEEAAVSELRSACADGDISLKQRIIVKMLEAESLWLTNDEIVAADAADRSSAIAALRNLFVDQRTLVLISSVAQPPVFKSLQQWSQESQGLVEVAQVKQEAMGVDMRYGNISTLGVDRWLAMIAAFQRASGPACIVDCGTAITVDFLGATGVHEGGLIAPGFATCLSSLTMADSLKNAVRTVAVNEAGTAIQSIAARQERLGLSSASCIFHGVERMVLSFLDSVFLQAGGSGLHHELFITGGGWRALAYAPAVDYRYAQNLVFEGLVHVWLAGHTRPFLLRS